jgi:Mg2+ and Co2+ transporter CorA
MKYYSEVTGNVYDTPEALNEAEAEALEVQKQEEDKKQKRAERAKEIEAVTKEIFELQQKKNELINQFIEDYGAFHQTIRTSIPDVSNNLLRLFDDLIM